MTADQLRQLAAEAGFEQVMKHKDGSTTVLPDALFERFAALVLAAQSPAEGDATLTEEQIDRFIPERIGVRNWGKPEQADLFNRGQVRDAIRTAIASQPNVQPKAAEVDAAPWSKTVESAAMLLQRCTGLELQDCENLAGTILGMAANVQPKGTPAAPQAEKEQQP